MYRYVYIYITYITVLRDKPITPPISSTLWSSNVAMETLLVHVFRKGAVSSHGHHTGRCHKWIIWSSINPMWMYIYGE